MFSILIMCFVRIVSFWRSDNIRVMRFGGQSSVKTYYGGFSSNWLKSLLFFNFSSNSDQTWYVLGKCHSDPWAPEVSLYNEVNFVKNILFQQCDSCERINVHTLWGNYRWNRICCRYIGHYSLLHIVHQSLFPFKF